MLSAIIFIIFLMPDISLISNYPVIHVSDFFILILLIKNILSVILKKNDIVFNNYLLKYFVLLTISAYISIFLPALFFSQKLIFADFMIIPQIVKYFILFSIIHHLYIKDADVKLIYRSFLLIGFLLAALGIAQFFNLLNINNWLTPFLTGSKKPSIEFVDGLQITHRIMGNFENPNIYGYNMLICYPFILVDLFNTNSIKGKILRIFILSMLFISILLSVSRTAILGIIIISAISLLLKYNKSNLKIIIAFILFTVLSLLIFTRYFETQSFIERVNLNSKSSQTSYNARFRDLINPFKNNFSSPIRFFVGFGPYKTKLRTDSHSEFGWYFKRFGIIGLFFYLILLLQIWRYIYNFYKESDPPLKNLNASCILAFAGFIIFCFSGNMFKLNAMMLPTFLIFALARPAHKLNTDFHSQLF